MAPKMKFDYVKKKSCLYNDSITRGKITDTKKQTGESIQCIPKEFRLNLHSSNGLTNEKNYLEWRLEVMSRSSFTSQNDCNGCFLLDYYVLV